MKKICVENVTHLHREVTSAKKIHKIKKPKIGVISNLASKIPMIFQRELSSQATEIVTAAKALTTANETKMEKGIGRQICIIGWLEESLRLPT